MRMYKLPPSRCHSYDLPSARKITRHNYVCESCGKETPLTTFKHNQWLKGKRTFSCRPCGGKVVWVNAMKRKVKISDRMDLIEF